MRTQAVKNQSDSKRKSLYNFDTATESPLISTICPINPIFAKHRATVYERGKMHAKRSRQTLQEISVDLTSTQPPGKDLDRKIAHIVFYNSTIECPAYSTDLNAAILAVRIVESRIEEEGASDMDTFTLDSYGENNWQASFGEFYWARAASPAHATCLACLEVIEAIEQEKEPLS